MSTDLRIPLASLPGFDSVGLTVLGEDGLSAGIVTFSAGVHVFLADDDGHIHYPEDFALDLADASTRDRVARYVAGRVGLAVGSTAPNWYWWDQDLNPGEAPHWVLQPIFESRSWPRRDFLADVSPYDDARLPDGSRVVDAVALARVAVHVGGRP